MFLPLPNRRRIMAEERTQSAVVPGAEEFLPRYGSKPKMHGLWIRLELRDGTVVDGIAAVQDLLQLWAGDGLILWHKAKAPHSPVPVEYPREEITQGIVLGVIGQGRKRNHVVRRSRG